MDKKYFEYYEGLGWDMLHTFNHKRRIFNKLIKSKEKESYDASGSTHDRTFHIEIKVRTGMTLTEDNVLEAKTANGTAYTADTLYIESHKATDLLFDYIYTKDDPIYINFLSNCVVLFNLARLSGRPKKSDTKNIKSNGYQGFEMAKRQELKLYDAVIFDYEGNIIKPMHK